jgi:hypothetical protein
MRKRPLAVAGNLRIDCIHDEDELRRSGRFRRFALTARRPGWYAEEVETQKGERGQEMAQNVDVTGLSPEAVRLVEQLVTALRERGQGSPAAAGGTVGADPWVAAAEAVQGLAEYDFGAWAEQRDFDQEHAQDHSR